jgi:hypothetical protein
MYRAPPPRPEGHPLFRQPKKKMVIVEIRPKNYEKDVASHLMHLYLTQDGEEVTVGTVLLQNDRLSFSLHLHHDINPSHLKPRARSKLIRNKYRDWIVHKIQFRDLESITRDLLSEDKETRKKNYGVKKLTSSQQLSIILETFIFEKVVFTVPSWILEDNEENITNGKEEEKQPLVQKPEKEKPREKKIEKKQKKSKKEKKPKKQKKEKKYA